MTTFERKPYSMKKSIENRVLVEGFIHIIQNDSMMCIIPLSIIDLCYNYTFDTIRHLILYCGAYNTRQSNRINQLQVLNLSTFTTNTINMNNHKDGRHEDRFCFASYLIPCNTIKSTPKWIFETINTNIEYNYDMLIRIGGYHHGCRCCGHPQTYECDIMLFNHENGYILPLPGLDSTLSSSTIVRKYNENSNDNDIVLLCIGGYTSRGASDIVRQFDLMTQKWQIYDEKLLNAREGLHAINLYNKHNKLNKLIVFGGCNNKTTELYVVGENENNMICSDMNYARYKSGYFYDNTLNHNIFIGGGSPNNNYTPSHNVIRKTMEIYDVIKDKWIMYESTMIETHSWNPCMWNSTQNPNIIYIAADKAFNFDHSSKYDGHQEKIKKHFDSFGCIEWTDLRENCKQWKLLRSESPLQNLFQMKLLTPKSKKIWERRSIVIS